MSTLTIPTSEPVEQTLSSLGEITLVNLYRNPDLREQNGPPVKAVFIGESRYLVLPLRQHVPTSDEPSIYPLAFRTRDETLRIHGRLFNGLNDQGVDEGPVAVRKIQLNDGRILEINRAFTTTQGVIAKILVPAG